MSSTAADKFQGDQCGDGQVVKDGADQAKQHGVSQTVIFKSNAFQTVLSGTVQQERCGASQSMMPSTATDKVQGDQCEYGQVVKDSAGQAEQHGVSQAVKSSSVPTVLCGTVQLKQCGESQSEMSSTSTDKFQGDQRGDGQKVKDGADQCGNVEVQAAKSGSVQAVQSIAVLAAHFENVAVNSIQRV